MGRDSCVNNVFSFAFVKPLKLRILSFKQILIAVMYFFTYSYLCYLSILHAVSVDLPNNVIMLEEVAF